MDNKIAGGIIGILAILAGFGGFTYLSADDLSNAYYCELTNQVGIFDRLSTSMKTGYFNEVSFPCKIGRTYQAWIPLEDYAQSVGVSPEELIEQQTQVNAQSGGIQYKCDPKECVRV